MRACAYFLSTGECEDLPEDIFDNTFMMPPGPAVQFGLCTKALTETFLEDVDPQMVRFHRFFSSRDIDVGLGMTNTDNSNGRKTSMTVPLWFDQLIGGTPGLALMLSRGGSLLQHVVRLLITLCRGI